MSIGVSFQTAFKLLSCGRITYYVRCQNVLLHVYIYIVHVCVSVCMSMCRPISQYDRQAAHMCIYA